MSSELDQLLEKQRQHDAAIVAAAVSGDSQKWARLRMRKDALPILVAEQRTKPTRERIKQLQSKLKEIEQRREETLQWEPEVTQEMRNRGVTAHMARNRRLQMLAQQESRISKQIDQLLPLLDELATASSPGSKTASL